MQETSVVCRSTPTVSRPAGAQTVYATFERLRKSRTIAGKLTRVQIRLPTAQALQLCRQPTEYVPADDDVTS